MERSTSLHYRQQAARGLAELIGSSELCDKKAGKRMRERRLELGLRLKDVAPAVGYSEPHLSRMETGKRKVFFETVYRIATPLLTTPEYLAQGIRSTEHLSAEEAREKVLHKSLHSSILREYFKVLTHRLSSASATITRKR